jgi:hypothetical protein
MFSDHEFCIKYALSLFPSAIPSGRKDDSKKRREKNGYARRTEGEERRLECARSSRSEHM